jgi:hypothetical protein
VAATATRGWASTSSRRVVDAPSLSPERPEPERKTPMPVIIAWLLGAPLLVIIIIALLL